MPKERQSNIELLRIVAMLLVLVIHANYWRIGVPTSVEAVNSPLPTFIRILIQHLASPCVDVFIIISGYFSIRPKMKSLCNLWFLLAFWGVVSVVVDGGDCAFFRVCLPFFGWFIPAYLGLYLVSPILNQYAENENGHDFIRYLLLFFALQTVFDLLYQGWSIFGRNIFNHGYSVLSFVPLYLLGRYFRLHRPSWLKPSFRLWFALYFGVFAIAAAAAFALLFAGAHSDGCFAILSRIVMKKGCVYTSPICLLGSVFLFLAFESLSFKSRLINRLAASSLGVFCFHSMDFYEKIVKSIYSNYNGLSVLVLDLSFIIGVFLVGTLLDQTRVLIWNGMNGFLNLIRKNDTYEAKR